MDRQEQNMDSKHIEHGLISGSRYISSDELRLRSGQAATALHDLGVWQGDRVALLLRNDIAFFEATMGASILGAATVPLNWHMTPDEIDYVLEDCEAKVVIVHADLLNEAVLAICTGREVVVVDTPPEVASRYEHQKTTQLAETLPRWDEWVGSFAPWDREVRQVTGPMFYTSGTTGKPKGVKRLPIGPDAIKAVQARAAIAFGISDGDVRSVMTGPLYHSAPNAYAMQVVGEGGLLVLQPRFDPLDLLRLIEEHRITNLHMVPTMFVRLLGLDGDDKRRYDLSSLKNVVHGAAPCPADVKRAMIEWWGPVIHEYYAMTETGFIAISNSHEWLQHPGSVGRAAPGVTIETRRDDNSRCSPGEPGEIFVRSEVTGHVAYHKAEEKTAELRHGDFVATGDIGYLNEEGFLFISDRKTDMVISGGVNIYPAEIEQALIGMPGISDCAVFGVPHPEFGEQLVAAIQLKSGASIDAENVREYLDGRLANYKIPRIIKTCPDFPREDSGKVKKHKLRDILFSKAAA
jgi:long-chain acyl-CoA synthetase